MGQADGPHTLSARAYDNTGRVGLSTAVGVTLDNTPLGVALTSITRGASVKGIVVLVVNATDNQAVTQVEFYDGATRLGTDTGSPYTLT